MREEVEWNSLTLEPWPATQLTNVFHASLPLQQKGGAGVLLEPKVAETQVTLTHSQSQTDGRVFKFMRMRPSVQRRKEGSVRERRQHNFQVLHLRWPSGKAAVPHESGCFGNGEKEILQRCGRIFFGLFSPATCLFRSFPVVSGQRYRRVS